jgi:hypothetical protein
LLMYRTATTIIAAATPALRSHCAWPMVGCLC